MPDLKFSCPHCQQHIAADSGYAGMQINCPSCNGSLVVPGGAAAPAPAPTLSIRGSAPAPAAPPPPPVSAAAPAAPTRAADGGCPSCGNTMPRGAVLCTNCGYNTATGQRTVAGKPTAMGKPKKDPWKTPWYKSFYPYLGLYFLVAAIFLYLGFRQAPVLLLASVGMIVLYGLAVGIMVYVAAFREGIGTGFMCLCVPFYVFYFVFKVNDDNRLKVLYGILLLLTFGARIAMALAKP